MAIHPKSYNKVQKIIQQAILEWEIAMSNKELDHPLKWSALEVHIYNQLNKNKLLVDESKEFERG